MRQMMVEGIEEIELPSPDGESGILLELYQTDEGDTVESIKEWCEDQSDFCHHSHDCCGGWYRTVSMLCVDWDYGVILIKTSAYRNV
jgi:hypothetical protein